MMIICMMINNDYNDDNYLKNISRSEIINPSKYSRDQDEYKSGGDCEYQTRSLVDSPEISNLIVEKVNKFCIDDLKQIKL